MGKACEVCKVCTGRTVKNRRTPLRQRPEKYSAEENADSMQALQPAPVELDAARRAASRKQRVGAPGNMCSRYGLQDEAQGIGIRLRANLWWGRRRGRRAQHAMHALVRGRRLALISSARHLGHTGRSTHPIRRMRLQQGAGHRRT